MDKLTSPSPLQQQCGNSPRACGNPQGSDTCSRWKTVQRKVFTFLNHAHKAGKCPCSSNSLLCCSAFQNGILIHRASVKRLKTELLCIFQSISSYYGLPKAPHTTVDFMVIVLAQILIWGMCGNSTLFIYD